ncbi:MAG: hypothetical protein RIQ79_2206, partial [Verrucomicrobiota bacterium]
LSLLAPALLHAQLAPPPRGTPLPPPAPRSNTQPPRPAPAPAPTPPPAPPAPPAPAAGSLGGPLAGLTAAQLAEFRDGLADFRQAETIDSGLGPIFNDISCVACHIAPAVGGGSRRAVTRFGRTTNGVFDPLTAQGGSLLQNRAIAPDLREVIPPEANTVAQRITTPLFGAGLIEAIPDATLRALASAPKSDGIRGHVSLVKDVATGTERVGRFGWKAQQATLLAFSGDAYVNEMGITNRFFPTENAPNGDLARLARADQILDPEDETNPATNKSDIDRAAAFMRLLAPPARGPVNATITAGQGVFATLNCTACHTPSLQTGPSPVASLANKPVALYSDLLLHDMGSLGDGIAQGNAAPREMRTAPLWGISVRRDYLHDGRATTLDAAIRAHDGEAALVRERYLRLTAGQRTQLVAFLNSL